MRGAPWSTLYGIFLLTKVWRWGRHPILQMRIRSQGWRAQRQGDSAALDSSALLLLLCRGAEFTTQGDQRGSPSGKNIRHQGRRNHCPHCRKASRRRCLRQLAWEGKGRGAVGREEEG